MESSLKLISIPKDPVNSRKAVKEILDAAQMSCIKPDASTSTIIAHAEAIRWVLCVSLCTMRVLNGCVQLVPKLVGCTREPH